MRRRRRRRHGMREGDAAFEALREAIEGIAAERVSALVAEAEAEAVAKARSMLVDAIADSLLERSAEALGPAPRERLARRPEVREGSRRPAAPRPTAPATQGPEPESEKRPPPTGEMGCYVYGITAAGSAAPVPEIDGVDPSQPVSALEHSGLCAIVSRVPLAEFGEEPLHENLNDVAWLEATARAHERVLEDAISRTTVVPLRLCTIYRNEQHVREMLQREQDVIRDALERLAGKTEWGVKMLAQPGALERAATRNGDADSPPADGQLSPGAAYLSERRREVRGREDLDRMAETWAEAAHAKLAGAASEALLNPIQDPEVSGYSGEMLLNGVYLVSDSASERFREVVTGLQREHEDDGVTLELTGPWPAYNFVKSSIEAAR
jgi:hypothetical protein